MNTGDFLFGSWAEVRREQVIEAAGVFWLAAELAILFAVLAARRHLDKGFASEPFRLMPRERRRAVRWCVVTAILAALVLGRNAAGGFIFGILMDICSYMNTATALRILMFYRMLAIHAHVIIWAVLVTAWVVIEVLIVYHGWRGYRCLRRILTQLPRRGKADVSQAV